MSPEARAYYQTLERLGLSVIGAGRLFGVHPRSAQRWAGGEGPIPWQVRASLTLMLRHGVRPPIPVNETVPVPRMDQIVITLLQQTGETLESALKGYSRSGALEGGPHPAWGVIIAVEQAVRASWNAPDRGVSRCPTPCSAGVRQEGEAAFACLFRKPAKPVAGTGFEALAR